MELGSNLDWFLQDFHEASQNDKIKLSAVKASIHNCSSFPDSLAVVGLAFICQIQPHDLATSRMPPQHLSKWLQFQLHLVGSEWTHQ